MKIVMITDTYPPNINGAALAAERLALELAKRNHKIYVIAPSTSFKHHIAQQDNITVYRVRSIPVFIEKTQEFRVSPQPLHEKEVIKIIKDIKPDIIHVNEPWLLGLSAIKIGKKEGIPVIATHHFMPENLVHYLHFPPKIEKIITVTIWKWYAKLCKNFAYVICPTQVAADLLKKYATDIKLKVISNGIDLKYFNKDNNGEYLKKKYTIQKKPTILFVGRLDKEKNIDVLIRALGLLKHKLDFQLVIVGQGKEKLPLRKLAVSEGMQESVIFTGFLPVKDLPNIYGIADIFAMPSIAELQSLVTMEAMASGLPIIAANAVALPHLVHDNDNGFLFTPGNEKDMAQKLLVLLENKELRKKMGRRSLAIIKQHDIKNIVKEVESLYAKAIHDSSINK